MKKKHRVNKVILTIGLSCALFGFSSGGFASAFQLFEQNAVNLGDFGAGGAAIAEDASTAYFNPAGMIRIPNQQLVLSGDEVITDIKFSGTNTWTSPLLPGFAFSETQKNIQGGNSNFIPAAHYVAPMCDWLVLGFSAAVPFDLETSYPLNSALRYSATETQLKAIDYSPSVAFKINNHFSLGVGFDPVRLNLELDSVTGLPTTPNNPVFFDSISESYGKAWGYGWHAGALFQSCLGTRVGLAYHSKLNFNIDGDSRLAGPLANGGTFFTNQFETHLTLPPTTTLSVYQDINPCWAADASVNFTQWSMFNQSLALHNVQAATVDPITRITTPVLINPAIPEHFRNTWRFAVGASYRPIKCLLLRAGLGVDQAPTNNTDRTVRIPDANRYATAIGAHYQATKTMGFDVGWTHIFMHDTSVNSSTVMGTQISTAVGTYRNHADLIGAQFTWDFC